MKAKRVTHYRSQKGRKYNAKHRAASARWTEGKGFQTRQDKLENPKDLTKDPTSDAYDPGPLGPAVPQDAITDVLAVPVPKIDIVANPPAGSYTGVWFDMPRPIWDTEPQAAVILTLTEARAKGYVVQIGAGMYRGCNRYKVSDGAPWIVCRIEGEPARPVPSPRPSIADLYARQQPTQSSVPCAPGQCRCTDRDCGRS